MNAPASFPKYPIIFRDKQWQPGGLRHISVSTAWLLIYFTDVRVNSAWLWYVSGHVVEPGKFNIYADSWTSLYS